MNALEIQGPVNSLQNKTYTNPCMLKLKNKSWQLPTRYKNHVTHLIN